MKISFERSKSRVKNYREHNLLKTIFREELLYELSNASFEENANGFEGFIDICRKTLHHNVLTKEKSKYMTTIYHF